jgi:hypothetical protein
MSTSPPQRRMACEANLLFQERIGMRQLNSKLRVVVGLVALAALLGFGARHGLNFTW